MNQVQPHLPTIDRFHREFFPSEREIEHSDFLRAAMQYDIVVALSGDEFVSFMTFQKLRSKLFGAGLAYVDEQHRRKGIYSQMLSIVES